MQALTEIDNLHSLYNQFTGFALSMRYDRERSWYEYIRAGFTADDLRLVLIYLKRGIKRGERHSGCLKFDNIIRNPDWFEMELEEAKAFFRNNRPKTNKEAAIEVFRPVVCEPVLTVNCKPAREVVKSLIDQLRKAVE